MLTSQLSYSAAALTFSGDKILTVENIAYVVFEKALKQKKVEILIPAYRGFLAKLGNFFPNFGFLLADILTKKGLKRQTELKSKNL